jgi:TPP-dependent pyruvate/acetoin dehydrogenase alpha subunit
MYTAYKKLQNGVIWENPVIVESVSYRVFNHKCSSIRTVFRHPRQLQHPYPYF